MDLYYFHIILCLIIDLFIIGKEKLNRYNEIIYQ